MAIKVQIIGEDKLLDIAAGGAFNIFLSSQIGSQALVNWKRLVIEVGEST